MVGEQLKFNPDNLQEGVFLVKDGGAEMRISVLASRTEGKLVFNIPTALTAGNSLEVRRDYGNSAAIRTGSPNDRLPFLLPIFILSVACTPAPVATRKLI